MFQSTFVFNLQLYSLHRYQFYIRILSCSHTLPTEVSTYLTNGEISHFTVNLPEYKIISFLVRNEFECRTIVLNHKVKSEINRLP